MTQATEVLFPSSVDEAVAQFGDGAGVTVVAGGTIVVPEITYGRLTPGRALMLGGAGLDTIDDDGTTVDGRRRRAGRAGSTELADAVPALAQCALNVADVEIRGQATVGGNLCAGHGPDAPRGDLQGAFLALGATARSAGAGGERSEPLEEFLDARDGTAPARRPLREAGGVGLRLARLPAHARVHGARGDAASARRTAPSGWPRRASPTTAGGSRRRRRPPRTPRQPAPRRSTTSSSATTRSRPPGTARAPCPCSSAVSSPSSRRPHEPDGQRRRARGRERAAHDAARRPPRGARDHEPEGRLRAGRLRRLHRPRRRRAAALVPHRRRRDRRLRGDDGRGARDAGGAGARAAGVHAPLRRAVRLLHLGDDGRGRGVRPRRRHRRPGGDPGGARRATSAGAPATSRSSTPSPRSRAATSST